VLTVMELSFILAMLFLNNSTIHNPLMISQLFLNPQGYRVLPEGN